MVVGGGGGSGIGGGVQEKKHLLFKSEEISTTGEDCSKGNSKEKEVRSLALRLDEAIRKAIYRLSTRGSKTRSGPCNRCE